MEMKNPYSIEFSHLTPFVYVVSESENIEYNFDLENYTTVVKIDLKQSSKQTFAIILGAAEEEAYIETIKTKYSNLYSLENEYENTKKYWSKLVKRDIKTGDQYTDIMANGWLIYQTVVCRLFARSGFYQSGGAIGFRDQLQDTLALISKWPEKTRNQIILNSSKQFEKGDVLHWWHDHNGAGIRTYFSDDYLWLAYVLSEYIEKTKDISILNVKTAYLEDKSMSDRRELYDVFKNSDKEATVYEHAKQAIIYGLSRSNKENGLLDIGDGDWNDGFSNIRGQSVWLTFFMINILEKFSEVSKLIKDEEMVRLCEKQRHILKHNIIANAWDGSHFVRAFFENGEILGSMSNRECKIDLISQAWAVIAMKDYPDLKDELKKSMESVETYLVDKKNMIVKLLYPPFDKPKNNPGYIKAYVPGTRENGGQYTHAATWLAKAYFELNEYDKGIEILKMINPISHSDSKEKADIYMVEPYVVAADIYSTPDHVGRGGWTWYTGSSAWMYKIIEDYLGKN
jgi:cellobiose phosphorylase